MLPEGLLCLLSASLAFAQSRTPLPINKITSLNTQRLPQQPSFAIPVHDTTPLAVSIALCSNASPNPRFFISNISNWDSQDDPGPSNLNGGIEIQLTDGQGNWTGLFPDGGILAVDRNGAGAVAFDVAVSDSEPFHQTLKELPLFGDTTSNQALLYSPSFLSVPPFKPTYPNYTLPAANLSQPELPASSSTPNFTLILSRTDTTKNIPRTGCFLLGPSTQKSGVISSQSVWARGSDWRSQFLMAGLTPATNYTAYVLQDSTKVSGPIYFTTKSAAFTCPLVHSLPFCPSVGYAVPLPSPPNAATYDSTNLPDTISTPLISYLANFTTVLTTFACGRDWYSPIVGCDDCQREYRSWLCSISFPRCGEPSPASPDGFTAVPAPPSATGIAASLAGKGVSSPQQVLSALLPQQTRDPPRNPFFPPPTTPYRQLLPCIEQCYATDRSCPPFLGFRCPSTSFNAGASYGIGYIDSADGDKGQGLTGVAQDRYGNVWCNLI
ncbi:hypothetical protein D9613_009149 [Agrocybe pediades]|uniref:Uncharacterized protein n=1 Tax=Agrocybe pediades TaxID=84607 RepID=A0A8H4R583_9AGAR|nr:hypothetical protein D9613_009149 [Agrocybe pediades]